jgi:glutamate 5-kinase
VLPVINENDTVVNDEIKFGDNDTLGALVANLVEADALVILTDQQGLFTADPRKDKTATLVQQALAGDPALETMAGGAGSSIGRGGMLTKILAAKRAAGSGASTVIAWGREPDALLRLCDGQAIGTLLVAPTQKQQARKQWMADHLQLRGSLLIDDGAVHKLLGEGKSLLPIGMHSVKGEFSRGDVIAISDLLGNELARGLANYASAESPLASPASRRPHAILLLHDRTVTRRRRRSEHAQHHRSARRRALRDQWSQMADHGCRGIVIRHHHGAHGRWHRDYVPFRYESSRDQDCAQSGCHGSLLLRWPRRGRIS